MGKERLKSKLSKSKPRKSKAPAAALDLRGNSFWGIHHTVARMPRTSSRSVQDLKQLKEQIAVQDVLMRYSHFYDGGDLEGVMSVFHDDCTLINPRGTYIGAEAIRRNYAFLISSSKIVLHLATNVIVRVQPDAKGAWMTAYYYAIAATADKRLIGTGGTYADRLVKPKGDWKIIERRITYNFRHTLPPEPPPTFPPPPTPTRKESSRDILGPDAEM